MIFRELLQQELETQSEGFKRFALEQAGDLNEYLAKLSRLCRQSYAEISTALETVENIGALPSEEVGTAENFTFSFDETWTNHEEARNWAF